MKQEKEQQKEQAKSNNNKGLVVTFRVIQSICFGVFALGLSMMAGDYSAFANMPVSPVSITTTIFGGIGAFMTGVMAKQCKEW